MNNFYIITFNNTHEAMKGESLCIEKKIKATMMPTPTYITKSCGISLKLNEDVKDKLEFIARNGELKYKSIFQFSDGKLTEIEF